VSIDDSHEALVVDDRAGFYMVPSASIAKARARLSGAHLSEALAGLVCLARESFAQYGASREEHQGCEANLDALAGRILGVSRARALRIVDNLVDAGALSKQAHRFVGTHRLPTKITFCDLAVSFAYVSGHAYRALATQGDNDGPPLGRLSLYVTLVALAGEQRDLFPGGNRRYARASQPELAKLSGLSVSSVKRAITTLKTAGLVIERPQPAAALKTKSVYRLVDPGQQTADHCSANRSQPDRPLVHTATDVSSQPDRQTVHSQTDVEPEPNRWSAHSPTDASPWTDRSSAPRPTHEPLTDPAYACVDDRQNPETQKQISSLADPDTNGEKETEADRLITTFAAWTRHALGDRRAAALYDAASWRRAANQLLEQYDLDRILAGIDRLRRDALLADRATTLPAFAAIAERAIARAAADRAYSAHRQPAGGEVPSWSDAFADIAKAIRRHGEAGRRQARDELVARNPAFGPFIDAVGWTALCREPAERHQYDWKQAWTQACTDTNRKAAA